MNTLIEIPTTSLIERMSNDEYHACPEFSSSQLKDILRSSAHFYSNNILKENERETKKHLDFGTLAHTLFLEPEQFEHEFIVGPKFDRRIKAGKEEAAAWEAANQGKIIIDQEMLDGANRIANNLRGLSSYKLMQDNYGMAEASIFFTDPVYGLNLRVRPDYHIIPCDEFPNGLLFDVKTTTDARQFKFQRSCSDFGYDISATMYREGFQQHYKTEEKPEFIFLVAESSAPFNVKQYRASSLFLSIGEQRYNKAKELLAESLLINEWDGYSTELEDISLPQYMLKQAIENDFN
ncbi:PD-(D/E)XK nuclease-like domain-containing protein [Acinetobacter ursingii]|uniref:PD-(D/E)XK nuclease-like domain-containing protein n=1 Tax=Acinetobacter ursingii TaxID=108980 RepID=UPI0024469F86|nr:PD-(D/E)XK nuclease-like domain-containing protein [Acinetobacter ursingii]MDG9859408.1 PD-(D/E)XK nuclease-like domain-containing protein [Acinetobacter ursingii]MDG9895568.1 PD-(D/E)XK nuclease-like domain-containing protein [Acinetobacter ursingii]MDH0006598.1 PD-(D/E)XK nuclease-like domain-containing protein [Acinetobacter ursingii]MDH0478415.1 PD-(D/E)XK nuclease-like domain-containing protein [Acinetobacter ursingii]MDH2118968.1 PD-(D/E)XK nuclease-like domain-containing protein [Aci